MDAILSGGEVREAARLLVEEATARHLTCGCAESCTGGLVAGAITAVAGSSAVLRGGIVSYDPAVKNEVLGVSQEVIDDPARGVVSSDCAAQMCRGARQVLGCDVAVSITGIAGPGGAEPGKPVGTVWFGVATSVGERTTLKCFDGDRDEVRRQAVLCALGLLREAIVESLPSDDDASEVARP